MEEFIPFKDWTKGQIVGLAIGCIFLTLILSTIVKDCCEIWCKAIDRCDRNKICKCRACMQASKPKETSDSGKVLLSSLE
jgi:hypothetical protein